MVNKSYPCFICQERPAKGMVMCRVCGRSYDKHVDGRTIADAIVWAADRARAAERRRWGRSGDRRPRRTKVEPAPKKRPTKSVESAMPMASLERPIGESGLRPGGFITGTVEEIMESAGDPLAWGSDD